MTMNACVNRGRWAVAVLGLAVSGLLSYGGDSRVVAQAVWPFHLEWDCETSSDTTFLLCVDGSCAPLNASPRGPGAWRAPLPLLALGEHRLVVQACRANQCLDGEPDLVVRVTPGSGRRPPIDVVNGPRIPLPRR
jgi:hypothetical protein